MQPEQIFKALSDETRLRIVHLIRDNRELCVCELTEALNIIQPKISRHLAILRKSRLLTDRREGQWIFYSITLGLDDWIMDVVDAACVGCKQLEPFKNDSVQLSKLNLLSAFSCKDCA